MNDSDGTTQPLEAVPEPPVVRPFIVGDKVDVKGQGAGKISQVFGNGDVLEVEIPTVRHITVSKSIVTHGN